VQAQAGESYRPHQAGAGLALLKNTSKGLQGELHASGARFVVDKDGDRHDAAFKLVRYGCDGDTSSGDQPTVNPLVRGPRVVYSRGAVTEWYHNGPLGVEQGFDLASGPSCHTAGDAEKLVLEMEVKGDLHPVLIEDHGSQWVELRDRTEKPALRYSDLYVADADGKTVPARMAVDGLKVALRIDAHGARYPLHVDPVINIWAQLGSPIQATPMTPPVAGDQFGTSIAISGDTAVVGAPLNDETELDAGSAYIFTRTMPGQWMQQAQLTVGVTSGALLGQAVAIADIGGGMKRVVLGAPLDNSRGSASWFAGSGGTWTYEDTQAPISLSGGDGFGSAVGLSNTRIIVGAPTYNTNDGYAAIYEFMTSVWTQVGTLLGPAGTGAGVGAAVGISGNLAFVGAPAAATAGVTNGGYRVYLRDTTTNMWSFVAQNIIPGMNGRYGAALAVSGNNVVVGSPGASNNAGAAFVNAHDPTTGLIVGPGTPLVVPGLQANDLYGNSVAIDGNLLVVGAPGRSTSAGDAYVWESVAGVWTLRPPAITRKSTAAGELFGNGVAVDSASRVVVVGAPGNDLTLPDAGAFYEIIERRQNGSDCTQDVQCASDFCIDGVCCDTACGRTGAFGSESPNDCQACNSAATLGTCSPARTGLQCNPAAAGSCELPALCQAGSMVCPANPIAPATTPCRPAAGLCDMTEVCDGTSPTCPADAKAPMGMTCRAAVDTCDVAETCDGTTDSCPTDAVRGAGFTCRAAAGACDVPETCDGTTGFCPVDAKVVVGTECRASAGACDPREVCDGTSPSCPTDAKMPMGTTCRPSVGACDVAETCDGTANTCPTDAKATAGTTCRDSAGACDLPEMCDGTTNACPTDAKATAGTTCRAAAGTCDLPEMCDGTTNVCPVDVRALPGTMCRASAGACDLPEICDGTSPDCPTDAVMTAGIPCRTAAGMCDMPESCDGTSPMCPMDAKRAAGTICRAALGNCDMEEACDGTADDCPADAKMPVGATCRAAAGACDAVETCDGNSDFCPMDAKLPAVTVCRAAAVGSCELDATCSGAEDDCPSNPPAALGTACRAAASECDTAESCDGTNTACPADITSTNGSGCAGGTCQAGLCRAEAELEMLAVSPSPVRTNSQSPTTVNFSIRNNGPSPANQVQVQFTLNSGVTLRTAEGAGWACQSAGAAVTCTNSSLAAGATSSISLTLAPAGTTPQYTVVGVVSSRTFDPQDANNSTTATVINDNPQESVLSGGGFGCVVAPQSQAPAVPGVFALALLGLVVRRRRRA